MTTDNEEYEDFGPVLNPDGTPTDVTVQMLTGSHDGWCCSTAETTRSCRHGHDWDTRPGHARLTPSHPVTHLVR